MATRSNSLHFPEIARSSSFLSPNSVMAISQPNRANHIWIERSKHSYVAAVTPAFNQQPAQAYQAPPAYRPAPVQQRAAAPPAYQQAPATPVYQQPRAQAPRQNAQNQNRRQGEKATFNPIPMSYTELYPSLLQKGLVVPRPMGPPPDRLPPWYNPNAHCPFHEGALGHDLEGCYALKHRVRELIESKILSFKDVGPNVKNNPLPPHGDPAVNAIEDAFVGITVDKVDDVKTLLVAFHARLVEAGLINVNHENCEECATHPKGCQVVRDNIQGLMDEGMLQISSVVKNEDVLVIEPCFNLPEPVEIPYYSRRVAPENSHPSPVEICMPTPFPYESTKAVPWKYEITAVDEVVEGSSDAEVTEALKDVEKATSNFTMIIGLGAFGSVYKAQMPTGETVAVKVLGANSRQGEQEFLTEVLLLGRLHHKNLVALVGYVAERGRHMLLYIYMSNGSFASHLYGKDYEPLSWDLRLSIALDVARVLEYLHYGVDPPIMHRDIKSSNILLDEFMKAKVTDFGLSRPEMIKPRASNIRGTFGYLDLEYISTSTFTKKSDVYSFGVLLFELITGRNPQQGLMEYVKLVAMESEGKIGWEEIVDPKLNENYDVNKLNDMASLAFKCVSGVSKTRPSMRTVVQALSKLYKKPKRNHSQTSSTAQPIIIGVCRCS
ncbi:protein NSP-INTERACTING KINASE 3 [Lathyrus oleraceus]|uniref:protein NSP-INTERACTING KINASE 3 n=1 Tax=Pisum sativum TaxID=3888 RepID=UPI0021D0CFE9|nr:protein NSP-INTERACTING KINASE 3-like [Pisum sativum]